MEGSGEIMNKKGNQRYEEMEKRIKNAFLGLLREQEKKGKRGDITVSAVCEKAGIHRTTFYGHYLDIPDLTASLTGAAYEELIGCMFDPDSGNVREHAFRNIFEKVRERPEFYRYLLENMRGIDVSDRLTDSLIGRLDEILKAQHIGSETELRYHQSFFCAGLAAMTERWLLGGCKEPPEEMEAILVREYSPDRAILMAEEK